MRSRIIVKIVKIILELQRKLIMIFHAVDMKDNMNQLS